MEDKLEEKFEEACRRHILNDRNSSVEHIHVIRERLTSFKKSVFTKLRNVEKITNREKVKEKEQESHSITSPSSSNSVEEYIGIMEEATGEEKVMEIQYEAVDPSLVQQVSSLDIKIDNLISKLLKKRKDVPLLVQETLKTNMENVTKALSETEPIDLEEDANKDNMFRISKEQVEKVRKVCAEVGNMVSKVNDCLPPAIASAKATLDNVERGYTNMKTDTDIYFQNKSKNIKGKINDQAEKTAIQAENGITSEADEIKTKPNDEPSIEESEAKKLAKRIASSKGNKSSKRICLRV